MNLPGAAWLRSLLWMGFVLLPFMSLPVLPADYRPLSVLPFALAGGVLAGSRIVRRDWPREERVLWLFFVVAAVQTLVLVGVLQGQYRWGGRHVAVLGLGILSYVSLKEFFRIYGVDRALRIMAGVFVVILALGVVELLCILHVLPWGVKAALNIVLGGRSTPRLQLVTSEASWAAKVLLFGLPILGFCAWRYRSKVGLPALVVALVLLAFTLSLEGLVAGGVAVVLFAVFQYRTLFSRPKLWLACGLVLAALVAFFALSSRFFPRKSGYELARIRFLITGDLDCIRRLPRTDASVFIRLYYPTIGLRMFAAMPYGVGLGGYSLHFREFLDRLGIDYSRFGEVKKDVRTQTGDPRSLYAKILAENGLVSGWIFLWFIAIHISYLKKRPAESMIAYRNLVFALIAVVAGTLLQFGSYAYLPMWFALALNATLSESQGNPGHEH